MLIAPCLVNPLYSGCCLHQRYPRYTTRLLIHKQSEHPLFSAGIAVRAGDFGLIEELWLEKVPGTLVAGSGEVIWKFLP